MSAEEMMGSLATIVGKEHAAMRTLEDGTTRMLEVDLAGGPSLWIFVRADESEAKVLCQSFTFDSVATDDVLEFVDAIRSGRARVEVKRRLRRLIYLHVPVREQVYVSGHGYRGELDDWEGRLLRT